MSSNSKELEKNYAEEEARWTQLGKLGMVKALQDYYEVLPEKVSKILSLLHEKPDGGTTERTLGLARVLGIKNGLGVVLATLGRDTGTIDLLQITMSNLQLHIGNRTTIFQGIQVGEHDLFALLVNLASSPRIKNLTLYTQSHALCTPANCIALEKAIASNTTLRELHIHHRSSRQRKSDSLYGPYHDKPLTAAALSRLVEGLRRNSSLETLELTTFPEDTDWVARILIATTTATRQEELNIIYVPAEDATTTAASTGNEEDLPTSSRINRNLKRFEFTATQPSESTWVSLLAPFSTDGPDNCVSCTTVTRLFFTAFPSSGIAPLCSVLRTNKTLKIVGLRHCRLTTHEWAEQIMVALQCNESVEHLDLSCSLGLAEDDVFDAIISLAQCADSQLTSICVTGTGLENKVGAIIEELRGKTQNRALLKTQASIVPTNRALLKTQASILPTNRALLKTQASIVPTEGTSPRAGRIVLCGPPFTGKTSICKIFQQRRDSCAELFTSETTQQEYTLPRHRGHRWPRRHLLQTDAQGRESSSALHDGLRSLDILDHDAPNTTSVWDFAGERKYHILHDYCFPNAGNSYFLYVSSTRHAPDHNGDCAVKTEPAIREEFRYWMRFLASKSKHVKYRRGQIDRPHVMVVLTNKDGLGPDQQNAFIKFAKAMVDDFRNEFSTLLDISNTLEFIDARSEEDVARLFSRAKDHLGVILKQSVFATEHEVCWRVRDALQHWVFTCKNPGSQPILTLDQVEELCVHETFHGQLESLWEKEGPTVPDKLLVENPFKEGLKTVLRYLNDTGDIIFLEKELDLVVVTPRWFIAGVFGSFIDSVHGRRNRETAAVVARTGNRNSILGCLNSKTKSLKGWTSHDAYDESGYLPRSTLDELFRRSLEKLSFDKAICHDASFMMIRSMIQLDMCFEEIPRGREEVSKNAEPRFFVPLLLEDGGSDKPSRRVLKWTVHLPQAQRVCFVGRRLECEDKSLMFLSPGFFPRLQVVLSNYFREQNWLDTEHFTFSQNLVRFASNGMEAILEYSGNPHSFLDILVRSTSDPEQTIDFIRNHVEKQIFEFCSSPKGCPGVTLVEAVIRPVCVEKLSSCEDRKDQAILVSTLDNYLKQKGEEYRHKWVHPIAGERGDDLAIEMLQGGSMARLPQLHLGKAASSKMIESRLEEFPLRIQLTTRDVSLMQKFEARMNPTRKLPVMLHLLCDGTDSDDPHEVVNQPGRILALPESSKSFNIPILRHVVNWLYQGGKVAAGFFNVQSVDQIDSFVQTLFRTPEIDIDNSILVEIVGQTTQSDPSYVPPKQELVDLLQSYMQKYPSTEWLKQFLNPRSVFAFYQDFKLRKVKHRDTKEVSWLCDNHFTAGLRTNTYEPAFH